ncbi:13027_t:CDS:2 [Acaulospora morrowiae]|uniref:13027_t:CDS:1 n=1 Tax=Acaulospora morrowiae TaxID=94023 RepID=A0A9N9ES59_9GLOM|nr:13027_t:CDS:2 [Acaulospora morrowiae]
MASLRKLVRSHPSFHFSLFPRFLSNAPSSKTPKIFLEGSFVDLRQEGGYYLDKTHFIPEIEDLKTCAILSLRPHHFGKTLFLSTLERFEQLFGNLYIGKNPTKLASSFLVLILNFAGLRTNDTYDIFKEDFHTTLNVNISCFMKKYRQELGCHFQVIDKNTDALGNFYSLLSAVKLSGHKLYVCIDEYDAGMYEALKIKTILQPLITHHKKESASFQSKIEKIESLFFQFYCRLKFACDNGIACVFQTGVTPVNMDGIISGFNISIDLTLDEDFWDLYGFKKSEIEFLLDNFLVFPSDVKRGIIEWLKEENDGYFFNPDQTEGIFNPARVLYCIENLMRKKKKLIDDDYQDASTNIKKLLKFPPELQSLPSQTALDLIVNNPLGKSILTEALNRSPLESRNGIEQRLRLTKIRELTTDSTSLLSFMFYTGAITYKPNPSSTSLQHSFRIPNRVAEREFITETLNIYDWKKEDLIPVRKFLQILEAEHNIEPLCRFIERTLLKPLKDNSVKHSNEEVLKQVFMDTLILAFHADTEPEFQVHSTSSNFSGKAIDLVRTGIGKRIAIEFDDIKIENVKLDKARDNWQEATEVSRSLLEKSEEEVLKLKINDPFQKNQKTVEEALEWKIKTKSREYLEPLQNRQDADLKCMFVILRVGLHRLISRKVYDVNE